MYLYFTQHNRSIICGSIEISLTRGFSQVLPPDVLNPAGVLKLLTSYFSNLTYLRIPNLSQLKVVKILCTSNSMFTINLIQEESKSIKLIQMIFAS